MKEPVKETALESIAGVTLTTRAAVFDNGLTLKQWMAQGDKFRDVIKIWICFRFWLGDWLNYGEDHFGEKYSQALDATMYTIGSLRNVAYVCKNIPPERRNANLTFGHHAVVAALDAKKQVEFLAEADLNDWTVLQLRAAVEGKSSPEKVIEPKKVSFDEWYCEHEVKLQSFEQMYDAFEFVWNQARDGNVMGGANTHSEGES